MPAQNRSPGASPSPQSSGWVRAVLIGRNPKVTLVRLLFLAALCVLGYKTTLLHIRVEGISMLPTYVEGSKHFVNRLAYLWQNPRRGDVVAIRLSDPSIRTPHISYLKRVIGLPGEIVAFVNGQVFINGQRLDEPYQENGCDWNLPPVTLGSNEYFVVGDNRSMPSEDHTFGKVERDRILGKVIR